MIAVQIEMIPNPLTGECKLIRKEGEQEVELFKGTRDQCLAFQRGHETGLQLGLNLAKIAGGRTRKQ